MAETLFDKSMTSVQVYFECEKDLEERPSERTYTDVSIWQAWELFRNGHGLDNTPATRASIMVVAFPTKAVTAVLTQ